MMTTRGYAFAPSAFYDFCAKEPGLCSTRGGTKVVDLTPARRAELEAINVAANRQIEERNDPSVGGNADVWQLPTNAGDCEDFAILKKAELLKRGWPASALLLTVATLAGEGHTVLTVRTNKGDLILDNRTNRVKDSARTPYRYFARQSQTEQNKWMRIRGNSPLS